MTDQVSVVDFDGDEAVAEAISGIEAERSTRSGLMKVGVLAGVGGLASLLLPKAASARPVGTKAQDVKILNYALTLEYLEAAFYNEASQMGYSGAVGRFVHTVASHENTHVAALKSVLGSKAVKSPKFDFKGTTRQWKTFLRTARVLEDTGVAAYQGQAPLIHQTAVLTAAGAILAVEARHASWVRELLYGSGSILPAPEAYNTPMSMSQVLSAVEKTGFIKS